MACWLIGQADDFALDPVCRTQRPLQVSRVCDVTEGLLDDEKKASSHPVGHARQPFSPRSLDGAEWKLNGLFQADRMGGLMRGPPSVPAVGDPPSRAGIFRRRDSTARMKRRLARGRHVSRGHGTMPTCEL